MTDSKTSFQTLCAALDTALAREPRDMQALIRAIRAVRDSFPADPSPDDVRAAFAACYSIHADNPDKLSIDYAPIESIKRLIVDPEGRFRGHIRRSHDHHLAFGRPIPETRFDGPIPRAYLPVSAADARELMQPLFDMFEAKMDADPLAHLLLSWDVLSYPVAPFDQVFEAWLKEVEAKGLGHGDSHTAIHRALALVALAEDRRRHQRVSRKNVDALLEVLDDPNPVLAAAAGRFLGMVHRDPQKSYNRGEPMPLGDLLNHLAERPPDTRRVAAGGFLTGYGNFGGPLSHLSVDSQIDGFDIHGWVLRILDDSDPEPYIPSAQAFWFYVHEEFCNDAEFMTRLIDHGHVWEAMMCATEIRRRVPGLAPVLERLAAMPEADIANLAAEHLRQFYTDA